MTEEKKNMPGGSKLFYKFLAWTFGITVVISMSMNSFQMLQHMSHPPFGFLWVVGIFCYLCLIGIGLLLVSFVLTQTCAFFVWFFRTLVARNINWIKKEFGLTPDDEIKNR
jgi:hypothetical protein